MAHGRVNLLRDEVNHRLQIRVQPDAGFRTDSSPSFFGRSWMYLLPAGADLSGRAEFS